jgi:chemotaxis protein CheY-P-specific phosphatase CheC
VLVLFPEEGAARLTQTVVAASGGALSGIPDPQAAVVQELSNILGQGVFKTMANSLKISLILSSPKLQRGSKAEVIGRILAEAGRSRNAVISLRIDMNSKTASAECGMALFFDAEPMRRLLKNAGAVGGPR